MSCKLKLLFVPVWLEKSLAASNESLTAVLDPEKLTRILSRNDLDLYNTSQEILRSCLPYGIANSFENTKSDLMAAVEDETKRGYLYGFLPDTDHLTTTPDFTARHVGYDYIVVTVSTEQLNKDIYSINLMEAIIEILCSVHPLEDVAKFPIMETWLKSVTKNRIL